MMEFKFRNDTESSVGFRIYSRYTWKAGAELILSVVDSSSVTLRFNLQKLKKSASSFDELSFLTKKLGEYIKSEFEEGSTGFELRFLEPKLAPVIEVELPSPFMYVGDEMRFNVTTKNLEGKILAYIAERDVALIPNPDEFLIKAVGPGKAFLKVGTKEFFRRYDLVVETPPEKNVVTPYDDGKFLEEYEEELGAEYKYR